MKVPMESDWCAELTLAESVPAGFDVPPPLLDAALHPLGQDAAGPLVPFVFEGVTVHPHDGPAARARVLICGSLHLAGVVLAENA